MLDPKGHFIIQFKLLALDHRPEPLLSFQLSRLHLAANSVHLSDDVSLYRNMYRKVQDEG